VVGGGGNFVYYAGKRNIGAAFGWKGPPNRWREKKKTPKGLTRERETPSIIREKRAGGILHDREKKEPQKGSYSYMKGQGGKRKGK